MKDPVGNTELRILYGQKSVHDAKIVCVVVRVVRALNALKKHTAKQLVYIRILFDLLGQIVK